MFAWPLSSWNPASVTQKLILSFNLKSYCTYGQWLPYWTAERKSHVMAFVPGICLLSDPPTIAHTPYQLYLARDFQFPGSPDNCLLVRSISKRLQWRPWQEEQNSQGTLPRVASPRVTTSPPQLQLAQVSPTLHSDSPPEWPSSLGSGGTIFSPCPFSSKRSGSCLPWFLSGVSHLAS